MSLPARQSSRRVRDGLRNRNGITDPRGRHFTGIATQAGAGGGIYWIVPASLGAVAVGMLDAWVLLIEILR